MDAKNKDKIYSSEISQIGDFQFDQNVADVFPDMLSRSIPGYHAIIRMIKTLTERYAQDNTNLYDLGCSLGASAISMREGIKAKNCRIIAIDNSEAMIDKCKSEIAQLSELTPIDFICNDLQNIPIKDASVVVMNFTLQFIEQPQRTEILTRIYEGMKKGGILILSEKVKFDDNHVNGLLIDVYHAFKKANGYSDLEISQKRTALENVLIPETVKNHRDRLIRAGFSSADLWFQCFNFTSMLAIK